VGSLSQLGIHLPQCPTVLFARPIHALQLELSSTHREVSDLTGKMKGLEELMMNRHSHVRQESTEKGQTPEVEPKLKKRKVDSPREIGERSRPRGFVGSTDRKSSQRPNSRTDDGAIGNWSVDTLALGKMDEDYVQVDRAMVVDAQTLGDSDATSSGKRNRSIMKKTIGFLSRQARSNGRNRKIIPAPVLVNPREESMDAFGSLSKLSDALIASALISQKSSVPLSESTISNSIEHRDSTTTAPCQSEIFSFQHPSNISDQRMTKSEQGPETPSATVSSKFSEKPEKLRFEVAHRKRPTLQTSFPGIMQEFSRADAPQEYAISSFESNSPTSSNPSPTSLDILGSQRFPITSESYRYESYAAPRSTWSSDSSQEDTITLDSDTSHNRDSRDMEMFSSMRMVVSSQMSGQKGQNPHPQYQYSAFGSKSAFQS
jgi:hypothetical protein